MKFNPFAALVALVFAMSAMFAPVVQADFSQDPAGEAAQVEFDGGEWEDDYDDEDDDEEDEWEGDW